MSDSSDVYQRLSAPFDVTFTDVRGGVSITYASGEQIVRRLNEVLGVGGWSFRVLKHEIHSEADEAWALGELVAEIDGKSVIRQQFGSQKLKRSRSNGAPLDIGFDLKGAATDAMKKCASLLGVGLYLSRKEEPTQRRQQQAQQSQQQRRPAAQPNNPTADGITSSPPCEKCGKQIHLVPTMDGSLWTRDLLERLIATSAAEFNAVLCVNDLHHRRNERDIKAKQVQGA